MAREEFDSLSGRVDKLETTVYAQSGALSYSASTNNFQGAPGFRQAQSNSLSPGTLSPTTVSPAAASPKPTASERTRYNQARALLKAKKYPQAANAFSQMLTDFPQGALAPNARYWLGECHYAVGDWQGAYAEFRQGYLDYPNSNKAPDYLLKMSYCLSLLGNGPAAMESLRQLLASYPDSDSAKLVKSGRTRFPAP
ncbi:MAG: tol-pal system protein YbgF [Deltaproteobacteria bacterium]|nr:tol-pal system protein YbgF [Deltaproteobacteria bacterium]